MIFNGQKTEDVLTVEKLEVVLSWVAVSKSFYINDQRVPEAFGKTRIMSHLYA